MQLDCQLPPGLGGLEGLGDLGGLGGGAAAGPPASSDLLESLQLDAFSQPLSSTGAGGQPAGSGSGSGSDSPVVLSLGTQPVPPAAAPFLPAAAAGAAPQAPAGQLRSLCDAGGEGASPATSESEARQRGRSGSPAGAGAGDSRAPTGAGGSGGAGGAAGRFASEEEKRLVSLVPRFDGCTRASWLLGCGSRIGR